MSESENRSISRRSALAGLGAGSLAAFIGAHAAAAPPPVENREAGGAPDLANTPLAGHALVGRWLSLIGLPSNPGMTVAVPTFFAADGTAMMLFPGAEAAKRGIEVRGVALGEWQPDNARSGHFTTVQVLSNLENGYTGTMTVDGHAMLADDDMSFNVRTDDNVFTMRDAYNAITELLTASLSNPMRGVRMRAGNPGFPEVPNQPILPDDKRTPY
jgi:hypothetical protein